MYGLSIRGDEWRPVREFLPRVETSPAGNVVLPVGRELQPAGESGELRAGFWTQYAYMVLTQHEALALADELRAQVTAAQAAGRRGTEDLLRCNPDESAGVREELELAAGRDPRD